MTKRPLKKQRLAAMEGKHHDKPIDRFAKGQRRPKVYTLVGDPIPYTETTMDPEGVPSWMKRPR